MSETTWETIVEQYKERAVRDGARIDELRQSTDHWHDTAQMLMRQRNTAEEERDGWKIRAIVQQWQEHFHAAGQVDRHREAEVAVIEAAKACVDAPSYLVRVALRDAVAALRQLEGA